MPMPDPLPRGKKVVIDTSCYIPYLNHPPLQKPHPLARVIFENTEYLSAVVLAELRAGADRAADAKRLEVLRRLFLARSRLLAPTVADWNLAGEVLIRLRRKFHLEGKGLTRLFNDVLIALSARRIGAIVITSNRTDFERIRVCYGFALYLWEE
jgi:predicted nucleic acid-binding protein